MSLSPLRQKQYCLFFAKESGTNFQDILLLSLRPCYTRQFFLQLVVAANVALQVASKILRVTPHICNLQCNKMLHSEFQKKAELSSTFLNVARQVAVCDMSIATCNAICENEPIRACLLRLARDFKMSTVGRVEHFHWARCRLRSNVANVWHPLCNFHCFAFVIVAVKVSRKNCSV